MGRLSWYGSRSGRTLVIAPVAALAAGAGKAEHRIPDYLNEVYWWTYVHPRAVRFFERQWLVNLILWGKYVTMRDATLSEMGDSLPQGNRTSEQGEEASEIGVVPPGSLKLAAQRLL